MAALRTPEVWLERGWTSSDWLPANHRRHFCLYVQLATNISYRLVGYSRLQPSRMAHLLTKYRNVPASEISCFGVGRIYRNLTLQQKEFCLKGIFICIPYCQLPWQPHELNHELSCSCSKAREPLKIKFKWERTYGTPCILKELHTCRYAVYPQPVLRGSFIRSINGLL